MNVTKVKLYIEQSLKKWKRLWIVLFTVMIVGTMTGCSSTTMPSQEPIPVELLQPCQAPILLTGKTGADILKNVTENAELWKDCRDSHQKLIDAVKKQ